MGHRKIKDLSVPRMLRTPGDASVWEQHGSIKRDRRHVPLASLLNLSIFVKFWKDFQNFGNIFLWVFQKSIAAPLGSRCISRVFYVPDPVTPSPWPGGGGRTAVSREGTVRPPAPVRVQVKKIHIPGALLESAGLVVLALLNQLGSTP